MMEPMRLRPSSPTSAVATGAAVLALGVTAACGGESPPQDSASPSPAATAPSASGASSEPTSPLVETEVPFTEPTETAPEDADIPATLYSVLSERLDPRSEHLVAYDGSNDPATGVGAGEVPGGWSLNAEWRPRGLVGVLVSDQWPDGWLCVDAYPGCRAVELPDGGTAQALPTGRTQLSVGFEQADGTKVIVSAVAIAELSAADLAATAADERLDVL